MSSYMGNLKKLKFIWKNYEMMSVISEKYKELSAVLKDSKEAPLFVPPGHFYSPIPSLEEIKENEEKIFRKNFRTLPGVDLNDAEQLKYIDLLKEYYKEMPFQPQKTGKGRYYFENDFYSYGDGIILYSMIRHFKPRRIIEAGSGFSSCVTLDTNELFFGNSINCTFIEPYPDRLLSLIKEEDKQTISLVRDKLQDVPMGEFELLSENDILFIDSTHVSKTNSDVNYILFNILPVLKKGVVIHFHDIFYPFEYLKSWIYEGRGWNEAYILRAFLEYNSAFKIIFFNDFLAQFQKEKFSKEMPLFLKNTGGSIWLKKVSE